MNFQSGMVCVGLGYPQMILAEQNWLGQSWYDQHRKDERGQFFQIIGTCMRPIVLSCEEGLPTATGSELGNLVKAKWDALEQ